MKVYYNDSLHVSDPECLASSFGCGCFTQHFPDVVFVDTIFALNLIVSKCPFLNLLRRSVRCQLVFHGQILIKHQGRRYIVVFTKIRLLNIKYGLVFE